MKLQIRLSFYTDNSINFYHPICEELRFSYWKEGLDFVSSAEIGTLPEGPIFPGETKLTNLIVIDGGFCKTLQVGDVLKFGAPNHTIGEFRILEIFDAEAVV